MYYRYIPFWRLRMMYRRKLQRQEEVRATAVLIPPVLMVIFLLLY